MLISARTLPSGKLSRIPDRKTGGGTINPDARRIAERSEDGRRQGDPWRRPRLAELRVREAEERVNHIATTLHYRTAAVRTDTVRQDSVIDAPFAALAGTAEFWALLSATSRDATQKKDKEVQTQNSEERASLDDLFARVIVKS